MDLGSQNDGSYSEASVCRVKCCVCGLLIDSNPSNMCPSCLRAHVDITDKIQREYIIIYCPECERYLQPPKYWARAELESRELMTLCLKRVRGINCSTANNSNSAKAKLVDAKFLWTEPHSKRIKLKLTVQKEVFNNVVIQQACMIEYVVTWQQCPTCQKVSTGQPQWDACVQLRQKVSHKKTFLYIEQLILKKRMHENFIRVENQPDGLDFFFAHKSHAMNFIEFINRVSPATRRDAVQLVSHDSKSNTAVQHFTFSLEIAPLCREDLVLIPYKDYYLRHLGGIGPLVLVHRVYSSIVFLDPRTLRAGEVLGSLFWKKPFESMLTSREMVEFYVLECTLLPVTNGTYQLGMVTVCLSDAVGEGREWIVQSHLGGILNPGDLVKGYLLEGRNFNDRNLDEHYYKPEQLQDVVLVRKHFPSQRLHRSRRMWRLKKLDVVSPHGDRVILGREGHTGGRMATHSRGGGVGGYNEEENDEAEFEDEVERDKMLRRDIDIYRVVNGPTTVTAPTDSTGEPAVAEGNALSATNAGQQSATGVNGAQHAATENGYGDDEEIPQVSLEEMLDELQINDDAEENRRRDDEEDVANELVVGVCTANNAHAPAMDEQYNKKFRCE